MVADSGSEGNGENGSWSGMEVVVWMVIVGGVVVVPVVVDAVVVVLIVIVGGVGIVVVVVGGYPEVFARLGQLAFASG